MISAEVIKGVQELLEKRGLRQGEQERLSDFVARGLAISDHSAEVLLEALHDGADVDEAAHKAGVDAGAIDKHLLTGIAQAIGAAAGRVVNAIHPDPVNKKD